MPAHEWFTPNVDPLLDPLAGVVPTWKFADAPGFDAVVAELGDPATVDDRVVALPPSPGPVVAGELARRPRRVDVERRDRRAPAARAS